MGWVDSHCHVQLDGREPDELIERALSVDWMVVPGVDVATSRAAAALAAEFPDRILWTAGLHPHDAEHLRAQAEDLEQLVRSGAAALGETGLDYYRNLSDPDAQRRSFGFHLGLAAETDLPVVVHCRDAFADVFEMLAEADLGEKAVLHCWTGGRKWTRRFLDLGVTFSFAGPLTFDTGETIRLAAELVPPGRAMVETDTPYLTPPPHRGLPNEPEWVSLVGEALARVWSLDVAEVAETTSATARRVFGWQA